MKLNTTRLKRDFKLGIKNLLLHKLRSLLTMLGLVFGVGSVIAMLAIGEGASEEAMEQIRKLGSRNIIVSSQKPPEDSSSAQSNVRVSIYGLLYDDLARISETIPTVVATVPVKSLQQQARLGQRELDLRIVGTTERWFELVERSVVAGRVMNERDVQSAASVVVLTEFGARRLLATESAIGRQIRISGNAYEIIGIVQSEDANAGGMQTPDRQTDAYIPMTTARQHYGDVFFQRKQGTNIREMVELHQLIVSVGGEDVVEPTAAARAGE